MKPSLNTIGLLIFTGIATAAFVWMAKRPVIEGNSINFAMPIAATEKATPPTIEENTTEQEAPPTESEDSKATADEAKDDKEPAAEESTATN